MEQVTITSTNVPYSFLKAAKRPRIQNRVRDCGFYRTRTIKQRKYNGANSTHPKIRTKRKTKFKAGGKLRVRTASLDLCPLSSSEPSREAGLLWGATLPHCFQKDVALYLQQLRESSPVPCVDAFLSEIVLTNRAEINSTPMITAVNSRRKK